MHRPYFLPPTKENPQTENESTSRLVVGESEYDLGKMTFDMLKNLSKDHKAVSFN